MHPEFFSLPIFDVQIKTYGFCLMVGFLGAVWLSMRRAQRVKANPDVVLDLSFLSLIFGVGGARAFYVIHYWQSQFATASNKWLAVIDITQGGLEFLGGFLGAFVAILIYCWWKRASVRLYFDILVPGVMWGLAFGRLGCFFNGCCFGGVCVDQRDHTPSYNWAIEFPYGSPAHWRQWEDREVTVPAELIVANEATLMPKLVPATLIAMPVERRQGPALAAEKLGRQYERVAASDPDGKDAEQLKAALAASRKKEREWNSELAALLLAQRYPSRTEPSRRTSVSELANLATPLASVPVHPTQLYSAIHAMLLSWVLSGIFYLRKRHGIVMSALLLLYPVPRMLLELIRADNPPDVGGLTVSQSVGIGMMIVGIASLVALYKWLPVRSPLAKPMEPAA